MNWIRYLIFGLIVSVCATAAFFAKDVVNWLNEAASFLTAPIVIPANIFNMLIGLLVMIGGLVLFWERKTARFDWRTFGKAVFAFGAFVVLYNFLEAAQAFIIWASLALAFTAFLSFGESRELRRANFDREARDREERLLNEIIEWATEIAGRTAEGTVPPIGETAGSDMVTARTKDLSKYLSLNTKSGYITRIAETFNNDNLTSAIRDVTRDLGLAMYVITLLFRLEETRLTLFEDMPWLKDEETQEMKKVDMKALTQAGCSLHISAIKVLRVAANIKASTIGSKL